MMIQFGYISTTVRPLLATVRAWFPTASLLIEAFDLGSRPGMLFSAYACCEKVDSNGAIQPCVGSDLLKEFMGIGSSLATRSPTSGLQILPTFQAISWRRREGVQPRSRTVAEYIGLTRASRNTVLLDQRSQESLPLGGKVTSLCGSHYVKISPVNTSLTFLHQNMTQHNICDLNK